MTLKGYEIEELVDALVSAYPSKDDLDMMITFAFGVDQQLDKITGGDDLTKIAFRLITKWAIPQGKIDDLIEKAYQENSNNPQLKSFYQKIKPSIFNNEKISVDNSQPISNSEWNELYLIFNQLNNNHLLSQICRQTLKNAKNDLLGNCLSLSNDIDLKDLKEILLTKFPKRNDHVPTILEFAERLSKKVDKNLSKQLDQWLKTIATKINISLPTYSHLPSKNEIYQYFLLITAIPKGKNQFDLESDLLLYDSSTNNYQPIPKFINCEQRTFVKCDFTEIKDKIFDLVAICREYIEPPYILNIQLFVTYPYLGYAFDRAEIVIDQTRNDLSYLGIEYPLFVSSYDRFSDKKHYNEFRVRWLNEVQDKLKPNLTNLIESMQDLEGYNHQNLAKLANQWRVEKIIGLKIMGCWCDTEKIQEDLFYYVVKSGIPLVLWIRCNDLPDCKNKLNDLLTAQILNNWHDLFKQVWECRQQSYQEPEKLGYHLGILADDPQRIPSHFKPLIETGK